MTRTLFASMVSLALLAAPALAADAPDAFKKCKTCHGDVGANKGKIGPDLATTQYTLEQMASQVKNGSEWDGKPAKAAGFESKKMPPQKGVSDDDVKAIYDFVQANKK